MLSVEVDPSVELDSLFNIFGFDKSLEFHAKVHQIRVITTKDIHGVAVVEGPHCDGQDWQIVAVFHRQNIDGGQSQFLPNGGGEPFFAKTIMPGKAVCNEDAAMWHNATDISACNNELEGHRDIFIIATNRWSHRKYGGVDVVSGPEMKLALKIGFAGNQMAFNGPYKTDEELETAVINNIQINIDSIDEGNRLKDTDLHLNCKVDVGLRVNPGVAVFLGDDPTFNIQSAERARESKFGFSIDDGAADNALAAIGLNEEGPLQLTALHCHLGSQITDEDIFIAALDRVFRYASMLRELYPITTINIGGGFGVSGIRRERRGPLRQLLALYGRDVLTDQKDGMDITAVANGIAKKAREHNVSDMRFFCEPGRALISDAMAMIARVIEIKRSGGLTWLMLDAGLNLFPTIAMAERHLIIPLDQPIDQPTQIYRVAGPLRYEGDILAETCALPTSMAIGDLISIEDSGAYTVSRSTNFILPRAAVVTIDTGHPELCWRREEFDDIFRFHVPLSNRSSQYNP